MRVWRNAAALPRSVPDQQNRRRHGRLRCDGLRCSLGEAIDLSASGMCVEGRGRPIVRVGEHLSLRLGYGDDCVQVGAQVVRVTKVALRRCRYALEFIEVSPEARTLLTRLASVVAERRIML